TRIPPTYSLFPYTTLFRSVCRQPPGRHPDALACDLPAVRRRLHPGTRDGRAPRRPQRGGPARDQGGSPVAALVLDFACPLRAFRSEEHTSELSHVEISYAV